MIVLLFLKNQKLLLIVCVYLFVNMLVYFFGIM